MSDLSISFHSVTRRKRFVLVVLTPRLSQKFAGEASPPAPFRLSRTQDGVTRGWSQDRHKIDHVDRTKKKNNCFLPLTFTNSVSFLPPGGACPSHLAIIPRQCEFFYSSASTSGVEVKGKEGNDLLWRDEAENEDEWGIFKKNKIPAILSLSSPFMKSFHNCPKWKLPQVSAWNISGIRTFPIPHGK